MPENNKMEEEVARLQKIGASRNWNGKLPFLKRIIRRMLGWYIEPIADGLQKTNQLLAEMMKKILDQNEALQEKIGELTGHMDVSAILLEKAGQRIQETEGLLSQLEGELDSQNKRISDIEKREEWTRERFEGQGERISDIEGREEWTRERFDSQGKRISDIEGREEWTRERFDSQGKRISDIEGREEWTRERFDSQGKRISDIEGREEWTRERFGSQGKRISDIEGREEWSRGRFNEIFDRLHRLDKIINYSILERKLAVPFIEEDGYVMSELMLNNRTFWMAAGQDADDGISIAVKAGYLSCGNVELLDLFRRPGVFLDLGANIGAFSLGFASQGWKGVAFEAGPKNCWLLEKSIEKNQFAIQLYHKAVYKESRWIYFAENGPWGKVAEKDVEKKSLEKTEAVALDDMIAEIREFTDMIDLVKIDIEGSEVAAIRGMKDFLKAYQYPLLYVELNVYTLSLQGESPFALYDELKKIGYHSCRFENGRILENDEQEFQEECCVDRLFIHDTKIEAYKIDKKKTISREKRRRNIISHMHALLEEKADCTGSLTAENNYVCFLLQYYPDLYEDKEIWELLSKICLERKKDTYLQGVLKWMKAIK